MAKIAQDTGQLQALARPAMLCQGFRSNAAGSLSSEILTSGRIGTILDPRRSECNLHTGQCMLCRCNSTTHACAHMMQHIQPLQL